MNTTSFQQIFVQYAKKNNLSDNYLTPFEMLETYKGIVDDFQNPIHSYNYILSENEFDLWIRNDIQELINYCEKITEFKDDLNSAKFLQSLSVIDDELRSITFEVENNHLENWWEKRILKKAGPLYAEDVKFYYNKEIEIIK